MLSRQACKTSSKAFGAMSSSFSFSSSKAIQTHAAKHLIGVLGCEGASAYTKVVQARGVSHLISQTEVARSPMTRFPEWAPLRLLSSSNHSRKTPILANEELLVTLRKQFPNAKGPTEIEVRLVVDEAGENPSTVQVCSLAEAIQLSLDRMTDLIGVTLKSDPPVIRAVRLSKLEYQKEQVAAKQKSSSKSKQSKTFRFRAGIDANDLNRKIQTMTKFLEQGIECEYTVFSKARMLRENAVAGNELVERIQALVQDFAVQKKAPQTNEQGNHIRVCLVPKKN